MKTLESTTEATAALETLFEFLQAVDFPAVVLSPEGRIVVASGAFERLVGLGPRSAEGRGLGEFIIESPETLATLMRRSLRSAQATVGGLTILGAQDRVPCKLRLRALRAGFRGIAVTMIPRHRASHDFQLLTDKVRQLENEVRKKREAEMRILALNSELESRVKSRTMELEQSYQEIRHTARELESAIGQRERAEAYLKQLLRASPVGICVINQSGIIEELNETLAILFGYTECELIGECVELLLTERHRQGHPELRRGFVATGGVRVTLTPEGVRGRRKDGSEFPVLISLSSAVLQGDAITIAAVFDRTEHQEIEDARRQTERQLAHASGMAEVATGVLHNIGNTINSINICAETARTGLRSSTLELLERFVALLESQGGDASALQRFLALEGPDLKVAKSLSIVTNQLKQERSTVCTELQSLQAHLRQVITIISSQQEFAHSMGAIEEIQLGPFLDKAIYLSIPSMNGAPIQVRRAYDGKARVLTDPHKLMTILVNLLSNARHALAARSTDDRTIGIEIFSVCEDRLVFCITDNGRGIERGLLDRIFQHGFTTRAGGEGFGLHVSATAAIELGGTLTAESDGEGSGARFTLTLPTRLLTAATEPAEHPGSWNA
ncbi:MAG: PAS domain S-box protein [Myxococcales bacterium]|nr:PAS domain S-box protein [Myxococcales bacterium]